MAIGRYLRNGKYSSYDRFAARLKRQTQEKIKAHKSSKSNKK